MPAQSFDQVPTYFVVYIFCFFVSTTIVILIGFIRRRRRLRAGGQNVLDGRVKEIQGDNT
jgi:hypothetical protein|tara:strand:- start:226 stop:405 length:180 start_codon:yes stop_codon:yes gene_type:complete